MSFDATPSDSSTHFHYPTAPTFSRSTTADTAASVETAITPFDEVGHSIAVRPATSPLSLCHISSAAYFSLTD